MKSMEQYSSGFKLSEIDLQLRGPGEIYGLKQSGIPDLKIATLTDLKTIEVARSWAQKIIDADPLLDNHPKLNNKVSAKEDIYFGD